MKAFEEGDSCSEGSRVNGKKNYLVPKHIQYAASTAGTMPDSHDKVSHFVGEISPTRWRKRFTENLSASPESQHLL